MNRYRLMWNETVYEPGEVKVVAYNADGSVAGEKIMRTAGRPDHIVLSSNRSSLLSDGEDLAYVTVEVADKDGNIVPTAEPEVTYSVRGNGHFRAGANGDPTSLTPFESSVQKLFSGAATAIIESGEDPGVVTLVVSSPGLKEASISLPVENARHAIRVDDAMPEVKKVNKNNKNKR